MFHHDFFHFGPRGRGFGRGGGLGGFFGGFGEHGGPQFAFGRKVSAADLQLLILGLLEEKPRHGYELIKELEERSGGFYAPSPGVIYPALTYLEELNYTSVETSGSKKLYSLTDEGRQHLEKNRKTIEAMMSEMENVSEKMQRMRSFFSEDAGDDVHLRGSEDFQEARMALRAAIRQKRHCSAQEARRIAEVLRKAAAEILQDG
ncbi:MAG TPA: PadR family transcriptional regulator [Planktothrix sp.]|jgi:DNA-binding PadR family transcriptional regulator